VTEVFIPHDDQKQAHAHLMALKRAGLFMPMGSGKTVTTLTALVDTHELIEPVFPALILAPKRVARSVWPAEVAKWEHTKHLRVSVIDGTAKQRERAALVPADIYTMAYDNIVTLVEQFGTDWPFGTLIADEWTRLKSFRLRQGGKRARALGNVAHTKVNRFVGLTGTPSAGGVKDLWGQLWFVDKGARLGRTFTSFEQRWFTTDKTGYGMVPFDHSQGEIQELIKDVCLSIEGLPVDKPIINKIMLEMPVVARALYASMQHKMFVDMATETIEAANPAVKTGKCLQIANGALYLEDGSWDLVHTVKLDALESIVEEANGAPVLVAYNFQSDLERIRRHFRYARHLDADPQTIDDWNAGRIKMLVAHPKAAGHGLNLAEGGNILAFFGLNWSLEEHDQIIERIGPRRQRQAGFDRPVFVHYIMADRTVDELVVDRLETRRSTQDVLLEAMRRYHDDGRFNTFLETADLNPVRVGGHKQRRIMQAWSAYL
jgi:SNF2 family DNA or RNA helicase